MHNTLIYTGTKRLRALIAILMCASAAPAMAAEPPERLDLSLGQPLFAAGASERCFAAGGPCTDPAATPVNSAADSKPLGFVRGLELGSFGPLRVKFTGKRIKMRIMF